MLSEYPETKASEFSVTCDAVSVGIQLLSRVESLGSQDDSVSSSHVTRNSESKSPDWESVGRMENSQHSPPMYPNDAASSQQQPKVQQMTDLSNCTVNSSSNSNNNNTATAANNNMANPLRIKHFAEHSDRELAELATQEISLDLQGLIDETHFPDDHLFGDLMDRMKNDGMYGMNMGRGSTPGSSGQNSPGSEGQNSPPTYHPNHSTNHYRNNQNYLPGNVHHGAGYSQQHHSHHPQV